MANLPSSAAGQNVQLRWRLGSDSSVSGTGWRVDTVQVSDGFTCNNNPPPEVTVSPASQSLQYSDPIAPVTISGTDSDLELPFAISTEWNYNGGAFTAGLPGWLSLANIGCSTSSGSGTCTWSLSGNALTVPGIYVVRATVEDNAGATDFKEFSITVVEEGYYATYLVLLLKTTP